MVMVAHVVHPSFSDGNRPASLSQRAIEQVLRGDLGFRGLVVTDVTPGGPSWQTLYDDPQSNGPDIILSVEGKPVRTEAELRNALKAEKPGSIVTLGVYNPRAQGRRVERIKLGDK